MIGAVTEGHIKIEAMIIEDQITGLNKGEEMIEEVMTEEETIEGEIQGEEMITGQEAATMTIEEDTVATKITILNIGGIDN